MLPNGGAPHDLHLFTKWPRVDEGGLTLLEQKIKEIGNVRLVVIDTLAKFRKPPKSNNNLYAEDYATTSEIKELADRLGVCIVLIHHLRKSEAEDVFDTLSGSLGLTGGTDGTLVLSKIGGNTTLHVTGRDPETTEFAMELDSQLLAWNIIGNPADIQSTKNQQSVYDAIKNAGEAVTPTQIAKITGLKYKYVMKILPALLGGARIEKEEKGKYIYKGDRGD
jgi:RecA-family ATPase